MSMLTAVIIIFIAGYLLIASGQTIKINKAATALLLGVALWIMYIFSGIDLISKADPNSYREFIQSGTMSHLSSTEQATKYVTDWQIVRQLGNIAEILFYLLGAMTIVKTIEVYGGFTGITERLTTRNQQKLLWLTAFITFIMSSVLDNMTTAIVMITLLQKIITNQRERWFFGSIVIIASNAGGSWSPIGDITTIMLWINDNITSGAILKSLVLPSIVSFILPTGIVAILLRKQPILQANPMPIQSSSGISHKEQNTILILGISCLLSVPIFKSLTNLPPFMGILLALGILWIYIEIKYNYHPTATQQRFSMPKILAQTDLATILFFLGILLAIGALESIGVLNQLTNFLDNHIHNIYVLNVIIGLLSAVIDNVPLVAAIMGMYPVVTPEQVETLSNASYMMNFIQNGNFWELIAYCTGTGGSILIIGSTAGVVVMGLEKMSFTWYLKHISWIALIGFFSGICTYYLLHL